MSTDGILAKSQGFCARGKTEGFGSVLRCEPNIFLPPDVVLLLGPVDVLPRWECDLFVSATCTKKEAIADFLPSDADSGLLPPNLFLQSLHCFDAHALAFLDVIRLSCRDVAMPE